MKKNVMKVLLVFAMMFMMFGCTTSVFAAGRDLVGRGTGRRTAVTTQTTTTNASGRNGNASSTASQAQTATATTVAAADTGAADSIIPFAVCLSVAVVLFFALMHLYLDQVRCGKDAKYSAARKNQDRIRI